MSTATRKPAATLDDLARVDGKAELIGGRIVPLRPTGDRPGRIAGEVYVALRLHVRSAGRGVAYPDNVGFAVPVLPSGRQSFSPDASYYDGPPSADAMDFVPGPPTFAVEVRSKGDYGDAAERDLAAKRANYFAAGTRVVWDVDPQASCVRRYQADAPDRPTTFRPGDLADAEPAVPGWRMAVADIFA